MAQTRNETRPEAVARTCTKQSYRGHAAARLALKGVRKRSTPDAKGHQVYPCDVCDGWHLTSKKLSGKTPPWNLDANRSRPLAKTPTRRPRRTAPASAAIEALSG